MFDLSWDGKVLAYVTNEDGMAVLHLMETATRQGAADARSSPPGRSPGCRGTGTTRTSAFTLTSARAPGDVYSLDVTTGKVDPLDRVARPAG